MNPEIVPGDFKMLRVCTRQRVNTVGNASHLTFLCDWDDGNALRLIVLAAALGVVSQVAGGRFQRGQWRLSL